MEEEVSELLLAALAVSEQDGREQEQAGDDKVLTKMGRKMLKEKRRSRRWTPAPRTRNPTSLSKREDATAVLISNPLVEDGEGRWCKSRSRRKTKNQRTTIKMPIPTLKRLRHPTSVVRRAGVEVARRIKVVAVGARKLAYEKSSTTVVELIRLRTSTWRTLASCLRTP